MYVRALEEQISQFQGIDLFAYPNNKAAETFANAIEMLHKLLSIVKEFRDDVEKYQAKINEYDKLK